MDFNSPVHPMLIALNNIKQEIDFCVSLPEFTQLPESLRMAMAIMDEEFKKVKGPSEIAPN